MSSRLAFIKLHYIAQCSKESYISYSQVSRLHSTGLLNDSNACVMLPKTSWKKNCTENNQSLVLRFVRCYKENNHLYWFSFLVMHSVWWTDNNFRTARFINRRSKYSTVRENYSVISVSWISRNKIPTFKICFCCQTKIFQIGVYLTVYPAHRKISPIPSRLLYWGEIEICTQDNLLIYFICNT